MKLKLSNVLLFMASLLLLGCDTAEHSNSQSSDSLSEIQVVSRYQTVPKGVPISLSAQALMLTGNIVDITDHQDLTWSVDDENIASISNIDSEKGMLVGQDTGSVTVFASASVEGVEYIGQVTLNITNESLVDMQVSPPNGTMPIGFTKAYQASLIFSQGTVLNVSDHDLVHWVSSDTNVATIDSDGIATGVSEGTTEITSYALVDGVRYSGTSQTLTVTNAKITDFYLIPEVEKVAIGVQTAFKVKVVFADGTVSDITQNDVLNWISSDDSIAKVDSNMSQKGIVRGVNTGSTTIIVEATINGEYYSTEAAIQVTEAVIVSLRVSPDELSLPKGLSQQFYAEAEMSDGTWIDITNNPLLNWKTSSSLIASVDNFNIPGLVQANSKGQVTIEAFGTINNQTFSDSKTFTVDEAEVVGLSITPESSTIPVGLNKQFHVIATLTDGSLLDVTDNSAISWSSNELSSATVSQAGLVTAVEEGSATITASGTANNVQFSASSSLSVVAPTIVDIELSASSIAVTEYYGVHIEAYAVLSDGDKYPVTDVASWQASQGFSVDDGYITSTHFVEGHTGTVTVQFDSNQSEVSVTMTSANRSIIIGRESAYRSELPMEIYKSLRFQGSAVLDGIYDAQTDNLLAGGTGGGLNDTDRSNYSDIMYVDQVTYLKGIYGTQWGASKGVLLQMLFWNEEGYSELKQLGKNTVGSESDFNVQDSILGVIVYSSSGSLPRYITGIQFVYK